MKTGLLYIHSDQHNPYVMGCAGDAVIRTPALDRLAAEGALFSNAYCPSPICVPSRMSTLTCRHPYRNEVWTNDHILDSGIPTLAHSLGAAGYRPTLMGRMHAIGPDQLHGYAARPIGDHSPNFPGGKGPQRGLPQGTAGPKRISLQASGAGRSGYQVHDEDVTAAAVRFIEAAGRERVAGGPPEPLCLTVGYMLPHPPYVAGKELCERYRDVVPPPAKPRAPVERIHPHLRWRIEDGDLFDAPAEEVARARAAYYGLVDALDGMIGRLLDALEAAGLAEETLVVYSSDHGDNIGEHGLFWKHTFYEESVKVPLIFRWPGRIPAGMRSDRVVSALDGTATILDALDAPALPGAQGRSMLKLLTGGDAATWDDLVFSEYCDDLYGPPGGCYQRMVRRDAWKLIYYHGDPPQLFNLEDDPQEMHDRADDPACKQIREQLLAELLAEWDPAHVARRMSEKRRATELLKAWTREINPPETARWALRPEMEYLL